MKILCKLHVDSTLTHSNIPRNKICVSLYNMWCSKKIYTFRYELMARAGRSKWSFVNF